MAQITPVKALHLAVQILGNATRASDVIGVTPQAVSEILRRKRPAPAGWCIPLERAVRQKIEEQGHGEIITKEQLRPDLYPSMGQFRATPEETFTPPEAA